MKLRLLVFKRCFLIARFVKKENLIISLFTVKYFMRGKKFKCFKMKNALFYFTTILSLFQNSRNYFY